jgi:hypothetical protein
MRKRIAIRSPTVSGEWKSNQGTKSDRELHVRGDPWTVSAPRVPRLTELFSRIATQAAKIVRVSDPGGPYEGAGEGRVGGIGNWTSWVSRYFRLEPVG